MLEEIETLLSSRAYVYKSRHTKTNISFFCLDALENDVHKIKVEGERGRKIASPILCMFAPERVKISSKSESSWKRLLLDFLSLRS